MGIRYRPGLQQSTAPFIIISPVDTDNFWPACGVIGMDRMVLSLLQLFLPSDRNVDNVGRIFIDWILFCNICRIIIQSSTQQIRNK
jgi:hypothetical protein